MNIKVKASFLNRKTFKYNLNVWGENAVSIQFYKDCNARKKYQKVYLQILMPLARCFWVWCSTNCDISVKQGEQNENLFFPKNENLKLEFKIESNSNSCIYILGSKEYYQYHEIYKNLDLLRTLTVKDYYCKGWIHDSLYKRQYMYIQFENRARNYFREYPLISRRRLDVKNAYMVDSFLWSGFETSIHIETPFSVSCYIGCYTIDGIQRFLMHTFEKNSDNALPDIKVDGILNSSIENTNFYSKLNGWKKYDFSFMQDAILIFKHHLGGGAENFIQKKIKELIESEKNIYTVEYYPETNQYKLKIYANGKYQEAYFEHIDWFMWMVIDCLSEIWINELVSYPNVEETLTILVNYIKHSNCKIKLYVHDYFCICPSINLLNEKNDYCALPEIDICNQCLKSRDCQETASISLWRKHWRRLLLELDEIICFSNSSVKYIKRVYPEIASKSISVCPHTTVPLTKPHIVKDNIITIGILGTLTHHKGLSIIKQIVEYIESNKLPIRVVLIGHSEEDIKSSYFIETGEYLISDIVKYAEYYNIDVFFMSSICPETFSYTISEMISMDLPILSFEIGAQGERIKKYSKGKTISLNESIKSVILAVEELYQNTK